MKRRWYLCLVFLLIFAMVGCGPADGDDELGEVETISVMAGVVGGHMGRTAVAICDEANQLVQGWPYSMVGGQSVTNVNQVSKYSGDIGMTVNNFLSMAKAGTGPYEKDGSITNLYSLFTGNTPKFYLIVADNVKSKHWGELVRDKEPIRLGSASPASPSFWINDLLLQYYGSSIQDMATWAEVIPQSLGENMSAWKDRRIDAFLTITTIPWEVVAEGLTVRPGKIWEIPEEAANYLVETYNFSHEVIPAGTYPGNNADVKTLGAPYVFFAHDQVSEDAAYYFTKAAAGAQYRLGTTVTRDYLDDWDPETMWKDLPTEIHPGALRYFRERGWMD